MHAAFSLKSLVYGVKCSTTPYRHKGRELRLHIFLTLSLHKWVCGFRFCPFHPKGTSIRCLLIRGCVDPRACRERLMKKRPSLLGLNVGVSLYLVILFIELSQDM